MLCIHPRNALNQPTHRSESANALRCVFFLSGFLRFLDYLEHLAPLDCLALLGLLAPIALLEHLALLAFPDNKNPPGQTRGITIERELSIT